MHDSFGSIGICDHDTIRCYGRLRGGAQRYRQPPRDIPGQWTCTGCGKERVWPTRQRCFRCGNPRDHDPHPQNNFTGTPPQRTAPTNPSFRPNRRQNKISNQHVSPAAAAQQFPPLPQQQQAEEGGTNDTPPPFAPGMRVDLLMDFLKAILSPEDFAKYSARLEPPPRKEETAIYQDLANKVKEHGKILRQVEHHRNVVRDAEAKLCKQQSLLQKLLERGQSLKQEIDTLQTQVAAAANSSQVIPPMPPPSNSPDDSPSLPPSPLFMQMETLSLAFRLRKLERKMRKWRRSRIWVIIEVGLVRFWHHQRRRW